jgi:hypothetical protein
MIARLVVRDRAIRLLPPWLLLGVLMGLMLSSFQQDAVRHGLTVGRHGFQGFRQTAYLPWGLTAFYLLYAGVTSRCSRLDMTLPIPHRVLWLSRLLALVLSAWALIGTAAVTLLARNWLQGFQVVGRTQVESLFAQLAAVSALAVVLASVRRASLYELPRRPTSIFYLIFVWIVGWGILFLLSGEPPGYALLPATVASGLGWWSYHSLPGPFVLVPGQAEAAPGESRRTAVQPRIGISSTGSVATAVRAGRGQLHLILLRTFYGHGLSWFLLALLLVLGLGASYLGPEGSLYAFWLFILYWLLLSALFGLASARLPMLDPLPVPRKLLFAYLVLPGLLLALLGYAGAHLVRAGGASRLLLVDYRQHPVVDDWDVQVPLISWEIGWDGQPPPVEEPYVPPWEVPYYPWSVSLFRGLPPVLYSPYHAPQGSPPEWVAGQLSQAVDAVYGTSILAIEIQRRYLVPEADGSTGVQPGGVTLLDDFPELRPVVWGQTLPLMVLLIGLPWLLYLALAVRGGYASGDAGRRPWGPLLLAGFALACILGALWSYGVGWTAEWKLVALTAILARKLAALLPANLWLRWGIIVALLSITYLLAQARFERIETPGVVPDGTSSVVTSSV